MNTFATITKIELKKLFQRKDSWLMFTVLLVPILYSVGLAANSEVITYTGAGNITAIGFASAMFQMSQSMFIFNVILSAIIGRSLASEIENKSIRLYINRILSTIKYAITVARTKFIFCAGFFYSLFCVFQRYRRHFRLYISDYAERG